MFKILPLLFLCANALDLEIVNQWNYLDFEFPYDYELINRFRPEDTIFTGIEVTNDRVFLAMPRLRAGVPASLATIPRHTAPGSSPPLRPYPNWDFHKIGRGVNDSCDGIISVYRIKVDSCNRLWVLDSGIMTSLTDFTRACDPKILIFDLATDQVVRSVIFPREVLRPASLLTNIVIDESVQGTCDKAFVYITDTVAPAIIVYDAAKDQTWRFMHPAMFPDPDFSDYTIAGEKFTLMDGIVGLSHSPKLATLYFQPLATNRIFSVATSILRQGPPAENFELPVTLVGKKSSQGLGLAVNTKDESIYFSPVVETSVATWNPVSGQQRLLAYDPQNLQFPAEIRYVEQENSIWLLTTRFQKFFRRTYQPNESNLRIIRIPLSQRIAAGVTNNIYF